MQKKKKSFCKGEKEKDKTPFFFCSGLCFFGLRLERLESLRRQNADRKGRLGWAEN
jgi:hypothetical protein